MSVSSARVFLERIMADDDLSRKLAQNLSRKRMEIFREAGFEFSEQELEEAKAKLPPGALGHTSGWLCQVPFDDLARRGRNCGGGLWH